MAQDSGVPSPLIAALRRALTHGGTTVDLGRIAGKCGYLDPWSRSILLNPDVDDEAWEAELTHDLEQLADLVERRAAQAEHDEDPADLRLIHGQADTSNDDVGDDDGEDHGPGLEVVG